MLASNIYRAISGTDGIGEWLQAKEEGAVKVSLCPIKIGKPDAAVILFFLIAFSLKNAGSNMISRSDFILMELDQYVEHML